MKLVPVVNVYNLGLGTKDLLVLERHYGTSDRSGEYKRFYPNETRSLHKVPDPTDQHLIEALTRAGVEMTDKPADFHVLLHFQQQSAIDY